MDGNLQPKGQERERAQTLLRGLDILAALKDGPLTLPELSDRLGLTKPTAHRIAGALVERGFLLHQPKGRYQLGPKILQLGYQAQSKAAVVRLARPYLETLARDSGDTVHLGRMERDKVFYLDKVAGARRVDVASKVGDWKPLASTGLGMALLLRMNEASLYRYFALDSRGGAEFHDWHEAMDRHARTGWVDAFEGVGASVRSVAAPVRAATGHVIAAVGVASAAQYMTDERASEVGQAVRDIAFKIECEVSRRRLRRCDLYAGSTRSKKRAIA